MNYRASHTAQVRFASNAAKDSLLETHELRTPGGRTYCGNGSTQRHLTHRDGPLVLQSLGRGLVTCGTCQRITGH